MILLSGQFAGELAPALEEHAPVGVYENATADQLRDARVLVTRGKLNVDSQVFDRLPNLEFVIKAGAGVDTIDVTEASKRHIRVAATGGSEESVADLAIGLSFACLRNIASFDRSVRNLDWASKSRFVGNTFSSRRIGVVGFGRIGRAFARMAHALGAQVNFWDRTPNHPDKQAFANTIGVLGFRDLGEMLAVSDLVSLHVPLTSATMGLIGPRELERMPRGAILINTSRAPVVVQSALLQVLTSGRLTSAGLDVHYREGTHEVDPLFDLDNVVLTPHAGAQSHQAHEALSRRIVEMISDFKLRPLEIAQ